MKVDPTVKADGQDIEGVISEGMLRVNSKEVSLFIRSWEGTDQRH